MATETITMSTEASAQVNLLDQLRRRTQVDLDSLKPSIAKSLGPFADCTSNQVKFKIQLLNSH